MHLRRPSLRAASGIAAATAVAVVAVVALVGAGQADREPLFSGSVAPTPASPAAVAATAVSNAAFDAAVARSDAENAPEGTPTALETGQPVTLFGNAPIVVADRAYQHEPHAGSGSAGYLQTRLDDDVRRIGATVRWPTEANGEVALILPSDAWTDTPAPVRPPAGVHFVASGNGQWHCSVWTGIRQRNYLDSETAGRFDDIRGAGARTFELVIDPATESITITLPGGKVVTGQAPAIARSTGDHAIWHLYEADGTAAVPAAIGQIWADVK